MSGLARKTSSIGEIRSGHKQGSAPPLGRVIRGQALTLGDDVNRVNNTGNVTQQSQDNIDPEMFADALLQKYAQGWQQNSEQYADKIH